MNTNPVEIRLTLSEAEANALLQILDAAAKHRGLELTVAIAVIFQKVQSEKTRLENESKTEAKP